MSNYPNYGVGGGTPPPGSYNSPGLGPRYGSGTPPNQQYNQYNQPTDGLTGASPQGNPDDDIYNDFEKMPARPPSAMIKPTAGGPMGRPITGAVPMTAGGTPAARPMTSITSNKGAGFGQVNNQPGSFDPLGQRDARAEGHMVPVKESQSHEEQALQMEKEIHQLVDESALIRADGETMRALEIAKEACNKERQLLQFREKHAIMDQMNSDLTFMDCENYDLALQAYNSIPKHKLSQTVQTRFHVNIGNLHFKQRNYTAAIKKYNMAVDLVSNREIDLDSYQCKIYRNKGNAYFCMGQFNDAAEAYEKARIWDDSTLFNLILCYYALGDIKMKQMKTCFQQLLTVNHFGLDKEMFADEENPDEPEGLSPSKQAAMAQDPLRNEARNRRNRTEPMIIKAAMLIAPVIERTPMDGFTWVVNEVHERYPSLAATIEMRKANYFLKNKEYDEAIALFKSFERSDFLTVNATTAATAAVNLSFIYYLEGDLMTAEKYADLAVANDRYQASALVNKGVMCALRDDHERAKELFLEAVGVEADCLMAIHNLGLVNKKLGRFEEAYQAFDKLSSIGNNAYLPNSWSRFHMADILLKKGRAEEAKQHLDTLSNICDGGDPSLWNRIADCERRLEWHPEHCYESILNLTLDLEAIEYLAVFYVQNEMYEKAAHYFLMASQIQSGEECKYALMYASCLRRMGAFHQALQAYEQIHWHFPQDPEALKYLVMIANDMQMKDVSEKYSAKLAEAERAQRAMAPSHNVNTPPPDTPPGMGYDQQPQQAMGLAPGVGMPTTVHHAGPPQTTNSGGRPGSGQQPLSPPDDDLELDLPGL